MSLNQSLELLFFQSFFQRYFKNGTLSTLSVSTISSANSADRELSACSQKRREYIAVFLQAETERDLFIFEVVRLIFLEG